jgi:PAS domain S-box-containing protein
VPHLQQSEEHYRDLVENSLDLMCTHDLNGVLLTINLAAARALGYEPSELVNRNLHEFLSPRVRAELEAYLTLIREKGAATGFMRLQTKSGETRIWKYTNTLRTEGVEVPFVRGVAHDFTETLRAQKALRESEERLRVAAEIGRMWAWDWDPATDRVRRSAECAAFLALNLAIQTNFAKDYFKSIHPDDRAGLWSLAYSLTPKDPVYRTVYRMFRPDGALLWLEESARATFDQAGKMVRLVGMTADITERKQIEAKLRASEERFRLAAHAGKMFAYEWDVATDVIVRSGESARILGIDEATPFTGQQALARVHPDDRERLMAAVADLSPEKPQLEISYRIVRPDSTMIWVERTSRAYFNEQGKMLRVVGMVADVTERKRIEEALKKSEEKFSKAFRESPMALTLTSATDHRYIEVNETFERLTGYSREEALGRTPFELGLWQKPSYRLELLERLLADGSLRDVEVAIRMKDGSIGFGLASAELIDIGGEQVVLAATADITDRKRADQALRESEEKFRRIFQNAATGMIMLSPEGRFLAVNQAYCEFLGYSETELVGREIFSVTHPEDKTLCLQLMDQALAAASGSQRYEKRYLHKNGQVLWSEAGTTLIRDSAGKPEYFVSQIVNITDRKRAEEALAGVSGKLIAAQEQERTRIARELHDDINQQLALLATSLDELKVQPPQSDAELRSRLEEVRNRTIEVSNAVQALSHQLHSSKLEYLGLVGGMEGFCKEFSDQHKVEVRFSHEQVPDSLSSEISLCLFRILQAALMNALKYSGVKSFEVRLYGTAGGVHLTVRDQGRGFDLEQVRSGHGIGLISMRERTRLVNGTISIESKPSCGTTIEVDVPLSTPTVSAQTASLATSLLRVMVVEDYEPFRRMISSILQNRAGVQVVCEVSDGLEAVQKAKELQPDLILLDIGLPRLNGIEVAGQISNLVPHSKILFLSQTTSTDVVQKALSTGASGYAVKTDVESELLTAVNAVLRGDRFVSSRLVGHGLTATG